MKRSTISLLSILSLSLLVAVGCKKKYDEPPANTIPEGNVISLASLVGMYSGSAISFVDGDTNIYCVVTADEASGNLYKNVYVTDGTAALNVRLVSSGGLYEGDSIRINLNGTTLDEYNGMMQLDMVDVDLNVVKQATNVTVTPVSATLNDVLTDASLIGHLVEMTGVEFLNTEVGLKYGDPITQFSVNRNIVDCGAGTVILRTSGFANFAGETLPAGNATITAIVGQYNADKQLYLRRTSDVVITGPTCQPVVYTQKNFEDENMTSGGWTVQMPVGAINWTTNTLGSVFGSAYGQCTNFSGGSNFACESWLISPGMDLSAATAPTFSFQNAYNYTGDPMTVWVSTNYDGVSAPASATWIPLSFTASPGGWTWAFSGNIDLAPYISPSTYVAFKYIGSSFDGSTWEVDEIVVQE